MIALWLWVACRGASGVDDTDSDVNSDDTDSASDTDSGVDTQAVDEDGDGYALDVDCDDGDAAVHPGADEVPYNGVDDDCRGGDETDVDGDGHDATDVGGDDCDDADAGVFPGAPELCDGARNDCDLGAWTLDAEDGLVTRFTTDGGSDVTAAFTGAFLDPVAVDLHAGSYRFCPGSFHVLLTADAVTHVELGSRDGAASAVLDADSKGSVITAINGADLVLDGLTVRGGNYAGFGGGLRVAGETTTAVVSDSVFTGNVGITGGGIGVEYGSVDVTDTLFTANRASDQGGGVLIVGGTGTFLRTTFDANLAHDGGAGLSMNQEAVGTVTDSLFTANSNYSNSYSLGLAIACVNLCDLLVTRTTIRDHVGYGAVRVAGGEVRFEDSSLTDNTADLGSAVYVSLGAVTLTRTTVARNGGQSAIYLQDRASASCVDASITANPTTVGAVMLRSLDASFTGQRCDLGIDAADNTPADVHFVDTNANVSYGLATFACASDACAP